MDLRTQTFAALAVFVAASIAMGLVYATRRTYPGFGHWLAASFVRLISMLLFLLPRDVYPAWLTIVVFNTTIVVEWLLYLAGARRFRGRPGLEGWMLAAVALFVATILWLTYVAPVTDWRIVTRSLFIVGVSIVLVRLLLDQRPPYFGSGDLLFAAVLGVVVAAHLFGAGYGLMTNVAAPTGLPSVTTLSDLYGVVPLVVPVFLVTVAQILMNAQRLEYEYEQVQARLRDDIAARERTEQELRLSEQRHRLLAENNRDVVWTMSLDGAVTYVSPSVEAVRGVTVEEAMRQPVAEIHPPDSAAQSEGYFRSLHESLASGRPLPSFRGDLQYYRRDGSTFWTEVLAYPLQRPDGSVEILGVTRDISQRKLAEERRVQLEVLRRQLEKSESLARMAGAIAHHVNNQLTAVIGFLEMAVARLGSAPGGDPRTPQLLGRSLDAANRAADVGRVMLTYLGHVSPGREPVAFAAACRGAVEALRATLPPGVRVETRLDGPDPAVCMEPERIRSILGGLVENACEAMRDGSGVIRVGVRTCAPEAIALRHRQPADAQAGAARYACLEVADDGCGIAEEHIEKLFDPFFTTKETGRGIGLPRILGIVRAHDGIVAVESRPGAGSVFRVYLPEAGGGAPAELPPAPAAPA